MGVLQFMWSLSCAFRWLKNCIKRVWIYKDWQFCFSFECKKYDRQSPASGNADGPFRCYSRDPSSLALGQ